MTVDEFLVNLTDIKDKYNWKYNVRNQIRGFLKEAQCACCQQEFCPITAVYKEKTNKSQHVVGATSSGVDIGLTLEDTFDIMLAADETPSCNRDLRDKLKLAVDLG